MEDIVGMVAEKAGIPETKAKLAIAALVERFDDQLPGPLAAQVKKILGVDSGGMMDSVAGDVMGSLGLGGGDDDDNGGGGLGGLAKDLLG